MSPEQEAHLLEIITLSNVLINNKYRAGQKAHGGNLFDLTVSQLLDEALNECIDQLTYILTAKKKLMETKSAINSISDSQRK